MRTHVWQEKERANIGRLLNIPSGFQKITLANQTPDQRFGNAAKITSNINHIPY